MAKKFNKQYIDKADKLIREILNDEKEYDDWTQISLTVQNAVQAAANIMEPELMRKFISYVALLQNFFVQLYII